MGESRGDPTIYWVDPELRGILPLDDFHVPRSLRRALRQKPFDITVDKNFEEVIDACAAPGPGRPTTWINDHIVSLYSDLHRMGHAHSVECRRDGRLVGGLYGVSMGAAFFGESMFSRETNASKAALVHLVDRLCAGGYRLLDTQFVTAHLAQFGVTEIPRGEYLKRLSLALRHEGDFYSFDSSGAGSSSTATSSAPAG